MALRYKDTAGKMNETDTIANVKLVKRRTLCAKDKSIDLVGTLAS